MKKISEHLGQIIVALAGVALLIAACVVFKAPIGNFFGNVVSTETGIGNDMLAQVENPDLSNIGGGSGNGGSTVDPSGPTEPTEPTTPTLPAGLYDKDDNLVASWAELTDTYGMDMSKDYNYGDRNTDPAHPFYVLTKNSALSSGTKLVVDDSVTAIGEYAFACTELTSLTFSENSRLTTIAHDAFYECVDLTYVEIPASVTSIGEYAFIFCKYLSSITVFATDVPALGYGAFDFCYYLDEIKVPAGCGDAYKAAEYLSEQASIIVEQN